MTGYDKHSINDNNKNKLLALCKRELNAIYFFSNPCSINKLLVMDACRKLL